MYLQNDSNDFRCFIDCSSIIRFYFCIFKKKKQVQFAYHEMHALTILLYGIYILVFSSTLDKLISITAFLFIFYLFSEIIFCNWLFNLGNKILYKIVVIRTLLGLAIGVGAIVAIKFPSLTLEIFGILFILVGTNIMLYVPVMKDNKSKNESYSTN